MRLDAKQWQRMQTYMELTFQYPIRVGSGVQWYNLALESSGAISLTSNNPLCGYTESFSGERKWRNF